MDYISYNKYIDAFSEWFSPESYDFLDHIKPTVHFLKLSNLKISFYSLEAFVIFVFNKVDLSLHEYHTILQSMTKKHKKLSPFVLKCWNTSPFYHINCFSSIHGS